MLDRQVLILLELADEVLAEEPPDVPVPSLGWTMWHPVWWLETLLAACRGASLRASEDVEWPGPQSVRRIRELWSEWTTFVAGLTDDNL